MVWSHNGNALRPTVMTRNGMVACAHPLAAMAGVDILRAGGNAVDAAVAVSAALDVTEPFMSGLGGGGAMLIRYGAGPARALHYGGYFPAGARLDTLDSASIDRGAKAFAVPGAPAGWFAAHAAYGSLDMSQVMAPAVALAEDGFALTATGAGFFKMAAGRLQSAAREVFMPGGTPPPAGTIIQQSALAKTYQRLGQRGVDDFYTGEIGIALVRAVEAAGGFLNADDLARPQSQWSEPSASNYRGLSVVSTGWPYTSYEILLGLNLLGQADAGSSLDDVNLWHARIEAAKLAMADRVAFGGESEALGPGLLSQAYAKDRAKLIKAKTALLGSGERYARHVTDGAVVPGSPADFMRECTTHFDVVDKDGNAVSVTQTLGSIFGSGFMDPVTGILLNNLMFFFDLDANSPMSINLGEMRSGPLSPMMLFKDDALFLMLGTPGAFGIPQTTLQMISNVVDLGMSVQAAIEAPRFRLFGGRKVAIESRLNSGVADALKKRGHELQALSAWSPTVGGGHGILIDPDTGVFSGGADPRRDGYALGY